MRKLSPAQERVLRQVAAGQVKLVYLGGNDINKWEFDAVGMGGNRVNRQYDVLVDRGLVKDVSPVTRQGESRSVGLTTRGDELLAKLGPAGKLIFQEFHRGTGVSWMIREEKGETLRYVLYKDGQVYDRYARPESVYTVFRSFCPYDYNFEGDMGL